MTLKPRVRVKRRDLRGATVGFVKAVVAAVPALISVEPLAGSKALSSAISSLVDSVLALGRDTSDHLEFTAYDVVNAAFAAGLVLFFSKVELSKIPERDQLEMMIAEELEIAKLFSQEHEYIISIESLQSPLLIKPIRDAATNVVEKIRSFDPVKSASFIRRQFESCMFEGFQAVWSSKPQLFKQLEQGLTGPFIEISDRRKAKAHHQRYVIKSFSQDPIFGQEETGITVSNLYVRQRCLWHKKEEIRSQAGTNTVDQSFSASASAQARSRRETKVYLSDLHETVHQWLAQGEAHDAVRVIAGGPGSGKSTFARAIMIEVLDAGAYDALFVPLQEIEPSGVFETRIEALYRNRTDLGFDRTDNPLLWLAQSQHDSNPPEKPLLLVCDGLDEIAPPNSAEAANVTTDFIQSLRTWITSRNSAGCYVKALVLGRDIAAKEAFGKLGIDDSALLSVGGLMPIDKTEYWVQKSKQALAVDEVGLASLDQRVEYWTNWAACNDLDPKEIPAPLIDADDDAGAIRDLTTEPLLLYLLLWTGYLGPKWKEAANNRNVVYDEIFQRIYKREWGIRGPKTPAGGHVGTRYMSLECFMRLQEALGLAAWQSGGRTVSRGAFDKVVKFYLDEDLQDDLKKDESFSLKSVALQTYARVSDDATAGYEFVHKSLSEYLIGRGLYNICNIATDHLTARISDDRCRRAAKTIAQIAHSGVLTKEIDRFFKDETRLRYSADKGGKSEILNRALSIVNWTLRNMMPVQEVSLFSPGDAFFLLDQAERRSVDVLWTFVQHLSKEIFSDITFEVNGQLGWTSGPLKLEWPSHNSLSTLICRLLDRSHVAESGRVCTFDRLDFAGQMFTELSLGSVIFDGRHEHTAPVKWLAFSARGSLFSKAEFYGALLWDCKLDMSRIDNCTFNRVRLNNADLKRTKVAGCRFQESNLMEANFSGSNLSECDFRGADLHGVIMSDTILRQVVFGPNDDMPRSSESKRSPPVQNIDFSNSIMENVSFRGARLKLVSFKGTQLSKVDFSKTRIDHSSFDSAKMSEIRIEDAAVRKKLISKYFDAKVVVSDPA